MYVYQMDFPIDDFALMISFKEYYKKCLQYNDENFENIEEAERVKSRLRRALRQLARKDTYWEGDIRGDELYIGSLPDAEDGYSSNYYFALKQDNNGSSFIISEIPFIHLDEFLITENVNKPITQKIQDGINKILEEFAPLQKEGIFNE